MPCENRSNPAAVAGPAFAESRGFPGTTGTDGKTVGLAIVDAAGLVPPLVVASQTATRAMASVAIAPTTHWPRPRLPEAPPCAGSLGGRATGRHRCPSHHHRPSSENCAIPSPPAHAPRRPRADERLRRYLSQLLWD